MMNIENQDLQSREEVASPATDSSALDALLSSTNIAEELDEKLLEEIGVEVYEGYKRDLESKQSWDNMVDEWVKLAAQIKEPRNYPWTNAANVKFPLLSTAAMQFAARAYPSLVPADGKVVQFKVVGIDPQGQKAATADRLAQHMNYQLKKEMVGWEEEMDRLLLQLPIVGCLFKKTYFDEIQKKNVSCLLGPKDLVVNYWAPSLEGAYRKTEIIPMTKNQLQSMKNAKIYLDVDLAEPESSPKFPNRADVHQEAKPSQMDASTPYVILEQHTYWDLDDDGYSEPYIITIDEQSRKVLRVVARWDSDGVKTTKDGEFICIDPVEYYTKYGFIPNPDGGFYDIGFGHLLGPLNEVANSIINLMIDAGTLSNLQSGFIGKGLRIKTGEQRLSPGEWRIVNAVGDDIKKQIFPLPVKEPSKVLFELLGLIIQSTKELASVAEIFVGKMPGQNTPATTTMASIEQGMKLFTAIYKRVYRSLEVEFEKIFRLNGLFEENIERAQHILDEPITKEMYDRKLYDVCPTADPTAVSTTQKMLKVQSLLEIIPLGTINVMEVTKRLLEAQEQPNMEALMQEPQPQVDPAVQKAQVEMQQSQQEHGLKMQLEQMKLEFTKQTKELELRFKMMEMKLKEKEAMMDAAIKTQSARTDMMVNEQTHAQDMRLSKEQHEQKMKMTKETNANKQRDANGLAGQRGNSPAKGSDKGKSA